MPSAALHLLEGANPGPYLSPPASSFWDAFFEASPPILWILVVLLFMAAIIAEMKLKPAKNEMLNPSFLLCASAVAVFSVAAFMAIANFTSWEQRAAEGLAEHYNIPVHQYHLAKLDTKEATQLNEPSYSKLLTLKPENKERVVRDRESGWYSVTDKTGKSDVDLYLFVDGRVLEVMTKVEEGKYAPYVPGVN